MKFLHVGLVVTTSVVLAGCGPAFSSRHTTVSSPVPSHGVTRATTGKTSTPPTSEASSSASASISVQKAFALAQKADSRITEQWTVTQWMPPWLVVSAPVAGDGSNTEGAVFWVNSGAATLIHAGTLVPHLTPFPIPGHDHVVLGLGTISGCAATGPYAVGTYCAEAFTNVLVLTPHWPYLVLHLKSLPASASVVSLPGQNTPGIDFVIYTPNFDNTGALTGWDPGQPFRNVVAHWDSTLQTLAVNHTGLSFSALTPDLASGLGYSGSGVYLNQVVGPAQSAGIPAPSVITAVDNTPVTSPNQLGLFISRQLPARPIFLSVWNGGSTTRYSVTPTPEPFSTWLSNTLAPYGG